MKSNNIAMKIDFWSVLKQLFVQKDDGDTGSHRNISFENNGRSGYVIYCEGLTSFKLYTEIGGKNCIFYIVIPSKERWKTYTGCSLDKRDEILKFISDECLKQQTTSQEAYYEIEAESIVFYRK